MTSESGRSLIEIIGVLAVAAVMTAGAVRMYSVIRNRQIRTIAAAELEQTAKNIRLLMAPRGDYSGVSVDYLVKAGALANAYAPIGGDDWTITTGDNAQSFSINLTGLTSGECDFFVAAPPAWATIIRVNGNSDDIQNYCMPGGDNRVSFIAQ